jgi:hypothetical protein
MRINNVSHIAPHDRISSVIHRTRSQIGNTFVDAPTEPKLGTTNCTTQPLDYLYTEVVCSPDLLATDTTLLGWVTKKKALNEKLDGYGFEDEIKSGQTHVSDEWVKPKSIHCGKGIMATDLIVNDSLPRFDYAA